MSSFRRMMAHFLGGLPVFGLYVLFPLVSVGYIVIEPLVIDIAFYRLHFAYQKKKKNHKYYFSSLHPIKLWNAEI